jgi:hypothetical protein
MRSPTEGGIDDVLFGEFELDIDTVSNIRLDKVSRLLTFIETGLDKKRIEVDQDRMSSVMMAFNTRLGERSMLRMLDPELVHRMILREEDIEYIPPVLTMEARVQTTKHLTGVWIERRKTALQWLAAVSPYVKKNIVLLQI